MTGLLTAVAQKKGDSTMLTEADLRSWKLLGDFRRFLAEVPSHKDNATGEPPKRGGPKRLLTEEDYLCSFLFSQFNPVIDSMRGLCACSQFPKVQSEVCSRRMSLGSFSEAQSVFGFERLEELFAGLVAENIERGHHKTGLPPQLLKRLRLVDSTVFHALPRMSWAHWRSGQRKGCAVRLHLKFRLLDDAPAGASVGPAKVCERKAFGDMVEEGEFYVGDRNYSRDYGLLKRLDQAGCGYVIRLFHRASVTALEELPITVADREAGVVWDRLVRLGAASRWHLEPVRVVCVEKPELAEALYIVTNQLDSEDLSAEMVAGIYRRRWDIELFFRWLKCIFGRPKQWHWFAESPEGVGIQLYTALIASLLLSRRLGKLPGKRAVEALHWHQLGVIDTAALARVLGIGHSKNPA